MIFRQPCSGAILSSDRVYRYRLWRIWDCGKPLVLFIGLNPSTADEAEDDPTIRRCIGFAKKWGYGGLYMGNLFALRATDPENMMANPAPIGSENHKALTGMYLETRCSVACWGVNGSYLNREHRFEMEFSDLKCLGVTKGGHPKHPLYLSKTTKLIDWPAEREQ